MSLLRHNALLQVAQTHYKKGYGHGHGKGKEKAVSGRLPPPAYPVSYTSLLSEVTPAGGHGGGLQQAAGGYAEGAADVIGPGADLSQSSYSAGGQAGGAGADNGD